MQNSYCGASTLCRGAIDYFENCSFGFLQVGDDFEEVFRLGIAGGAEHAHEDLGGTAEILAQLHKADRAVDVLAEDGFSGVDIAGDHAADGFTEQGAAEAGALLEAAFDCLVEVFCEGHHCSRSFRIPAPMVAQKAPRR